MIVINANDSTPTITILPNVYVPAFVDGISGYYLEFIDDETQTAYEFGNGENFDIDGDFFQIDINNSNDDLKPEKYYTCWRMKITIRSRAKRWWRSLCRMVR